MIELPHSVDQFSRRSSYIIICNNQTITKVKPCWLWPLEVIWPQEKKTSCFHLLMHFQATVSLNWFLLPSVRMCSIRMMSVSPPGGQFSTSWSSSMDSIPTLRTWKNWSDQVLYSWSRTPPSLVSLHTHYPIIILPCSLYAPLSSLSLSAPLISVSPLPPPSLVSLSLWSPPQLPPNKTKQQQQQQHHCMLTGWSNCRKMILFTVGVVLV